MRLTPETPLKQRKSFLFCISIGFILMTTRASAEIRLPAIIGTHMVLQQKTMVNFWGWSEPGETINISPAWDTITYHTRGTADGKWILKVGTPAAGGPYTIVIKGSNMIVLEDVLVGEVWDCSGQSNMEMSFSWGIKEYTNDMENAKNEKIRLFKIPRLTSVYPQDDTKAHWVVCSPDEMKKFSMAGYFFGLRLQNELGVPVGLIDASWGGTPAESWTPRDSIDGNQVLREAAKHLIYNDGWPITPSFTYNAMIYPITRYNIAGVIWYQGEANVDAASSYQQLLSTMIRSWRSAWQEDLPFYIVQIAPFAGYSGISGALLREAQTKTTSLPNTGFVVIDDLVTDVKQIHPRNKKDVGFRLANYALSATYRKQHINYKSPQYQSMAIYKDKITISFDNAPNGLISKSGTPTEFYIAGADKVFVPAIASLNGNKVTVWNSHIPKPLAVRFGFTNSSIPDLFSKEGLPVNLFRTDDWNDVMTVPAK